MLLLLCKECGATATTECSCPPDPNRQAHEPACQHANLDMQLECPCCPNDHDHGAAANACPNLDPSSSVTHEGQPCPFPEGKCGAWISGTSNVAGKTDAGPCPGGHCAPGVQDCTICRPITIIFLGAAAMRPAPAATGG